MVVPSLARAGPDLLRADRAASGEGLNTYGFLGYPLLQSADILIYRAAFVPVGEDRNRTSSSRGIARRFNNFYGAVLSEPDVRLTPTPKLPGTDGRKMSKSYANTINLGEDEKSVRQKLKTMVTDPARKLRTDPGDPAKCPVFDLHKVFSTEETRSWAAEGCRTAGIGCIECKSSRGPSRRAPRAHQRTAPGLREAPERRARHLSRGRRRPEVTGRR
jgi:tryptophanyl-tRNA synthetase